MQISQACGSRNLSFNFLFYDHAFLASGLYVVCNDGDIRQKQAKQSIASFDEGSGRNLYALQIAYGTCTLSVKIIDEFFSVSYSG